MRMVVGLEIHAQLPTRTKMYCRCPNPGDGALPNSSCCPTCLGLPGALPRPNREALAIAARAAALFGASVAPVSVPERKSYFYPDLPKGYQISQFAVPFAEGGGLEFAVRGERRSASLRRLQVEEDTAQMTVRDGSAALDFNRSGVPLLEIVTEPDFTEAEAVGEFLRTLRAALREGGICDGRMETGSLRCEPNVSVEVDGEAGQKVEIKNVGSIRAVEKAVAWEADHQRATLAAGGGVEAVTKGWDDSLGECVVQRRKETAADYRYFPEPDLPALTAPPPGTPPANPAERVLALAADGVGWAEARLLGLDDGLSRYVEAMGASGVPRATAAPWVAGPLLGAWREAGDVPGASPSPEAMARLVEAVERGEVTVTVARRLVPRLVAEDLDPLAVIAAEGLAGGSDLDLEAVAREAVAAEPEAAARFREGKEAAAKRILGAGMRLTRGRADPEELARIIARVLTEG